MGRSYKELCLQMLFLSVSLLGTSSFGCPRASLVYHVTQHSLDVGQYHPAEPRAPISTVRRTVWSWMAEPELTPPLYLASTRCQIDHLIASGAGTCQANFAGTSQSSQCFCTAGGDQPGRFGNQALYGDFCVYNL